MRVITHLSSNSRMGYFLWLNESINTINVANVTANINPSNTDMAPPLSNGSEPTTLELPILLSLNYTIHTFVFYIHQVVNITVCHYSYIFRDGVEWTKTLKMLPLKPDSKLQYEKLSTLRKSNFCYCHRPWVRNKRECLIPSWFFLIQGLLH